MDSSSLSEARFLFALTACPSLLSVSETVESLLGFDASRFMAGEVSLRGLVHPGDQGIADRLFSTTDGLDAATFNIRLRQRNGVIRCFSGRYTKSSDGPGGLVLDVRLVDAKSQQQSANDLSIADKLAALLANTDDFVYFKDRNHVFTGASPTLVSLTPKAEQWQDLIGKTDYDLFPEDYADIYYELEKQVFVGIPVAQEVQRILTREGKKGWVDNRKYPIRNAAGEIVGLFGIARDITEQKCAEDALAESEHRFRSIFEQVPSISVQGYNKERKVIFWNQASERLYGYTCAQALGHPLEELIIPEPMRESVIRQIAAWVDGGPAIPPSELTLRDREGKPVEVFSSHVMLRGRNGEPEMYCIDVDLAEHKRIEDALRLSEERYRFLADNIADVIWMMNLEGRFTYVSPSIEKLRGYTPAEAMKQSLADVLVPNSYITASTALERIASAVRAGEPVPDSRGELEVRCKDGSSVWTEVTSNAMRNAAGEFIGILGVSRDITQRKKMEAKVHQLAFHDPLTDLPNRRLLSDRLEQAMVASKRSGCFGALMFLDLDNFKPLNDLHGHEVGDLLLIEAADRLRGCVRETDTVARFGGDEFVVMVRELEVDKARSTAQAAQIAEKIRLALSAPYSLVTTTNGVVLKTVEHHCSASIGVVLFNNHDADQKEILKWADAAMYQAKEAGRNRVLFHSART